MKWECHICFLRGIELKNWQDDFHKCLLYRRLRLISQPTDLHQESLPILGPMNLLLGLWLDFHLFLFFAHKYSLQARRLACSLQFLCYFQINSISGHLSLFQFTSDSNLESRREYTAWKGVQNILSSSETRTTCPILGMLQKSCLMLCCPQPFPIAFQSP